jgi:hypothetical protein
MSFKNTRLITGLLFISGAILVNIPYTLLMMTFDYPNILRQAPGMILTRFAAGGPSVVWTWLAFAWLGLPILVGIVLLPRAMGDRTPAGQAALFFGSAGALAQIIGLLRWPFVVSIMAQAYSDPQALAETRETTAAISQAVHQYGGVILGEHIGQLFSILWMILLSVSLWQNRGFPRWLPISGFIAAGIYALAQGEMLATAIPGFPVWGPAGLIGSLLWLGWMIVMGFLLVLSSKEAL